MCLYVLVCICVSCLLLASVCFHAELARAMIAACSPMPSFIHPSLSLYYWILLAFPPTILRLEGFQWTFISLCAVIIPPTPHTLSLPHFIMALWGASVTGPLDQCILFHYLSTQVIKANLLISPHLHQPLGGLSTITALQPHPPYTHPSNKQSFLIIVFILIYSYIWFPALLSELDLRAFGSKLLAGENGLWEEMVQILLWFDFLFLNAFYILSPLQYDQFNEMSKYWKDTMQVISGQH